MSEIQVQGVLRICETCGSPLKVDTEEEAGKLAMAMVGYLTASAKPAGPVTFSKEGSDGTVYITPHAEDCAALERYRQGARDQAVRLNAADIGMAQELFEASPDGQAGAERVRRLVDELPDFTMRLDGYLEEL